MRSLIIPAHNEASVIARGLAALTEGAADGEQEIIVVCNGCTDATADVARGCGPQVRVIETSIASKSNALNLGDRAATGFPRFFIDADVLISRASLALIEEFMTRTETLAAAPAAQMDLEGCGRLVRWYYEVDQQLPSARFGIGCAGVYVLSRQGRRRFGDFPPIIADDAFVRLHFRPDERARVDAVSAVVRAPRTFNDLVAVMTRVHFGNLELQKMSPHLWHNNGQGNRAMLVRLMKQPAMWPKIGVYLWAKIVAKGRSHWRYARARGTSWERDETRRQAIPEGG